jgi:hypothetical protein
MLYCTRYNTNMMLNSTVRSQGAAALRAAGDAAADRVGHRRVHYPRFILYYIIYI